MNRILFVLIMSFLLTACGPEKGMEVHEIWMRPAAQGENGAVYFVIHNHSSKADEIVGASTDAAEAVEIHESKMNGDVAEMTRVLSVPLEGFGEVKFVPGKLHLMLVHLKKSLTVGDEILVTLHFKNSDDLKIKVPVHDTAAPEEDHSSADH